MLSVRSILVGVLACLGLGALGLAKADGPTRRVLADEVREYDVFVKGKPAGKTVIRITEVDDGTTTVSTNAAVKLDFLIHSYRYEFHGREIWQGLQLVDVNNRAVDDGKQLEVRATADANGSIIEATGQARRRGPALTMTTNIWRWLDIRPAGALFSILNADQGLVLATKAERIGPDPIVVAGQQIPCTHYRLSGGYAAELWFDGQDRLVRQQTVEDGYPTEVRLAQVRREVAPPAVAAPAAGR